jgi:hypothetical protein
MASNEPFMVRVLDPLSPTVATVLGTSGTNVAYTLLGAGVAATATLLAVALKFVFDTRTEREKHQRELERLRLELDAARTASLQDNRRQLFASMLTATHTIYDDIVRTRRRRRHCEIDDAAYATHLREISPIEAQAAVEENRLIARQRTCERADALWHHLRSRDVAKGSQLGSREWTEWKDRYWTLRRELVAACKADLGLADLDHSQGGE